MSPPDSESDESNVPPSLRPTRRLWPSRLRRSFARARAWWTRRTGALLPGLLTEYAPLDLRIVGKVLLHAALVGIFAGVAGAVFFGGLERLQRLVLEDLAGYVPLRAHGESFGASERPAPFRPWLLWAIPGLGGLLCGLISRLAPQTRGGGADDMIESFHRRNGFIPAKVIWVKALASFATLGTGGAGGREGPTMQIGGAIGSLVARLLAVSARERRILMIAGVAAGISAVFRTPLGAALLAVEVLYRDGYESDALVPSILASVISYSVVISIYGESTLFAHAPRFPFVPAHLPLYALLALAVSAVAVLFVRVYRASKHLFLRVAVPEWARPALGGLALGVLVTGLLMIAQRPGSLPGQGLGLLGGGYGAVQTAISGAAWLPIGWFSVLLLFSLSMGKLVFSSLTIGSGGSAGDFAPSLAIGGLFGGAFGRAAQLLFHDPRLDAGAFALVGMGAFYGGIAHVPLSALVLVCELAGNYDLLVPLMLALGVAFVALRKHSLYEAQAASPRESPVHRDALVLDVLKGSSVQALMTHRNDYVSFALKSSAAEILRRAAETPWQDAFPVTDAEGRMIGLITSDVTRVLAAEKSDALWTVAADLMRSPVFVRPEDDLRTATERLVSLKVRELPVLGKDGKVLGFLDEAEVARIYLMAAQRAERADAPEGPTRPGAQG